MAVRLFSTCIKTSSGATDDLGSIAQHFPRPSTRHRSPLTAHASLPLRRDGPHLAGPVRPDLQPCKRTSTKRANQAEVRTCPSEFANGSHHVNPPDWPNSPAGSSRISLIIPCHFSFIYKIYFFRARFYRFKTSYRDFISLLRNVCLLCCMN